MVNRIGSFLSNKLRGSAYDDYISDVLGGNDTLFGYAGDDYIVSRDIFRRTNFLDGGEGNDTLLSYKGVRNTLVGGSGNDSLNSSGSKDSTLQGGEGNDTLKSSNENNTLLSGDEGNDFLYSYRGNNNILRGGLGDDTVRTIDGTNKIYSGFGQDIIESGGKDVLIGEYQNSPAPIILEVNPEVPNSAEGTIRGAIFDNEGNVIQGLVNTSFSNIESFEFFGSQSDDVFITGNGDDILEGGAGNDTLNAQAGNNVVRGQDGDDLILSIERGTLSGGAGDDLIFAQAGNFEINGDEGNDDLFIIESSGTVDGGEGFDNLRVNYQSWPFSVEMNLDSSTGGTIVSRVPQSSQVSQSSNSLLGTLFSGIFGFHRSTNDLSSNLDQDLAIEDRIITFNNIEAIEVFGSLGDDNLIGSNGPDLFNGNEGLDTLTGGAGADTFRFNNPNFALDNITDFDVSEDKFDIVTEGSPVIPRFPDLGSGQFTGFTISTTNTLAPEQLTIGSNATDSNHRIVYDNTSGSLFYDSDGVGSAEQILFAQLSPHLALTPSNFIVR